MAITIPPVGTPWSSVGSEIVAVCNAVSTSYIDVNMTGVPGGATVQTIANAGSEPWAANKLRLNNETSDVNALWDTTNFLYTVPTTGTYMMRALVRLTDGQFSHVTWPYGSGMGIGVHTSEIDIPSFQWNKIMPMEGQGGTRLSLDYTRVAGWNAGDLLRLYVYQDSGGAVALTRATLQIYRIA